MTTPSDTPIDLEALRSVADERFWPKTRKYPGPLSHWVGRWGALPEGCCLLWKKSLRKDGTGQFWFQGKNWAAHRIAYMLEHGTIPKGRCVVRICGLMRCVNPEHLKLVDEEGLAKAKREGRKARKGKPSRRLDREESRRGRELKKKKKRAREAKRRSHWAEKG
jgi:hypothetical protein